jgi:hypothetical protein
MCNPSRSPSPDEVACAEARYARPRAGNLVKQKQKQLENGIPEEVQSW